MQAKTLTPDAIEALVIDLIKRHTSPKRIILFGSRARGDNAPRADFDIAIDDDTLTPAKVALLRSEIEELPTLHEIDLVWLNGVNEKFRQKIVAEGRILYER